MADMPFMKKKQIPESALQQVYYNFFFRAWIFNLLHNLPFQNTPKCSMAQKNVFWLSEGIPTTCSENSVHKLNVQQ